MSGGDWIAVVESALNHPGVEEQALDLLTFPSALLVGGLAVDVKFLSDDQTVVRRDAVPGLSAASVAISIRLRADPEARLRARPWPVSGSESS